eukprot:4834460-Pyramimonas_sp.AAC.1
MLSRRQFFPPGAQGQRISRYISPDSSPQANFDYFCTTEELLIMQTPFVIDDNFNALKCFEHKMRSLPCMTLARGESSAAMKVSRLAHSILLECGDERLWQYRCEVKGFLSDQGSSEKKIKNFPFGKQDEINDILDAMRAGTLEVYAQRAAQTAMFWNALSVPGMLHIIFNALQECLEGIPEWKKFEKQLKAICKICGEPSYKE